MVEPKKRRLFFAKAGFRRLEASFTPPEVAPAPIIVCISSIKSTAFSCLDNSLKTTFNLFSKSPLYLVPANNAPKSKQ